MSQINQKFKAVAVKQNNFDEATQKQIKVYKFTSLRFVRKLKMCLYIFFMLLCCYWQTVIAFFCEKKTLSSVF